jgi:hypothetical protein
MSRTKQIPTRPESTNEPADQKRGDRRAASHFDARHVFAGQLGDATVRQAVEGRR